MNAEDLTHDEIAKALVERQRGKARRRTILAAVAVVMIVGLSVATTLAVQGLTAEDQRADRNAGIAGSYAEQLESEGITPSIDPEQIQGETDDPEIQDLETQDPERQDPETQDPERQDPERQDPEKDQRERDDPDPDDPEGQDPEVQEGEVDDPDPDDPEIQDPETQDPEVNDPQDPPATYTFHNFPLPNVTMVCTLDEGSPPQDPTYTCALV